MSVEAAMAEVVGVRVAEVAMAPGTAAALSVE